MIYLAVTLNLLPELIGIEEVNKLVSSGEIKTLEDGTQYLKITN